jgi:hypothetical protein
MRSKLIVTAKCGVAPCERKGAADELVFYCIAALTVAGALAAVLLKNTVHCALALTVAFAGLALLFLNSTRSSPASRRFWSILARSRSWWCLRFC